MGVGLAVKDGGKVGLRAAVFVRGSGAGAEQQGVWGWACAASAACWLSLAVTVEHHGWVRLARLACWVGLRMGWTQDLCSRFIC